MNGIEAWRVPVWLTLAIGMLAACGLSCDESPLTLPTAPPVVMGEPTPPAAPATSASEGNEIQMELAFSDGCADLDGSRPVVRVQGRQAAFGMPANLRISWSGDDFLTIALETHEPGVDRELRADDASHVIALQYLLAGAEHPHSFTSRRSVSGRIRVMELQPSEGRAEIVFDHLRLGAQSADPEAPACELHGRIRTEGEIDLLGTR